MNYDGSSIRPHVLGIVCLILAAVAAIFIPVAILSGAIILLGGLV